MKLFQDVTNNYTGISQDKMMKYKQILNEEKAEQVEFKNNKKHQGEYDYYTDDYDTFTNNNVSYKASNKTNNYLSEDDYSNFNNIKVEDNYDDYDTEEESYVYDDDIEVSNDNNLYDLFNSGYKWFVVLATFMSIIVVIYLLFTLNFVYIFLYLLILLTCFMLGYILMFVLQYFIN